MADTPTVVNADPVTKDPAGEGESSSHIARSTAGLDDSPADGADAPPQPGSRTDPNLLLKSLKETREEKKRLEDEKAELERRLQNYESSVPSDAGEMAFSDEGKILEGKIKNLESAISDLRSEGMKKDLLIAHPILKERWNDFEAFHADPENKGMNLRTAAKAFLVENGLMDVPRKGLERPTGGRAPAPTGMTAEDVDDLRKNDFKKYRQMLKEGKIKIG